MILTVKRCIRDVENTESIWVTLYRIIFSFDFIFQKDVTRQKRWLFFLVAFFIVTSAIYYFFGADFRSHSHEYFSIPWGSFLFAGLFVLAIKRISLLRLSRYVIGAYFLIYFRAILFIFIRGSVYISVTLVIAIFDMDYGLIDNIGGNTNSIVRESYCVVQGIVFFVSTFLSSKKWY